MPRVQKSSEEVSDHAPRAASEPDPLNYQYRPSNQLPDPTPRPGFRFGWIRHSCLGTPDQSNWYEARADGWEPVLADSVPEMSALLIEDRSGGMTKALQGYVEHKGNVLCIIPEYKIEARDKYYREKNNAAVYSAMQQAGKETDGEVTITAKRRRSAFSL